MGSHGKKGLRIYFNRELPFLHVESAGAKLRKDISLPLDIPVQSTGWKAVKVSRRAHSNVSDVRFEKNGENPVVLQLDLRFRQLMDPFPGHVGNVKKLGLMEKSPESLLLPGQIADIVEEHVSGGLTLSFEWALRRKIRPAKTPRPPGNRVP